MSAMLWIRPTVGPTVIFCALYTNKANFKLALVTQKLFLQEARTASRMDNEVAFWYQQQHSHRSSKKCCGPVHHTAVTLQLCSATQIVQDRCQKQANFPPGIACELTRREHMGFKGGYYLINPLDRRQTRSGQTLPYRCLHSNALSCATEIILADRSIPSTSTPKFYKTNEHSCFTVHVVLLCASTKMRQQHASKAEAPNDIPPGFYTLGRYKTKHAFDRWHKCKKYIMPCSVKEIKFVLYTIMTVRTLAHFVL